MVGTEERKPDHLLDDEMKIHAAMLQNVVKNLLRGVEAVLIKGWSNSDHMYICI